MRLSLFLALRYLKPKRTFVSVITLLSVLGVSLGVTVLIVVIAVMAGFERRIKETVLGFEPHVTLETQFLGGVDENGFATGNGFEEVVGRLREVPGVTAVAPFVQGPVFVEVGTEPLATLMRAIDPAIDPQARQVRTLEMEGTFDLDGSKAVLGSDLARQFGIRVGDVVTVYSPHSVKDLVNAVRAVEDDPEDTEAKAALEEIRDLILPFDLEVTGIFDSMHYGQFVFVPLHVGQQLYELEDAVPGISIATEDAYRANEFKQRILEVTPPEWWAVTWAERHQQWFDTIRMERTMMYFVLFIIMLVAGFCIMVTMITVTVQKRQEIGLVGALGSRVSQIVWIFLAQGMVVGVIGVAGGMTLGGLILRYRNGIREFIARTTGHEIFDSDIYGIAEIPARILPVDVAVICGGAFVLCALAALLPALFAAVIDPAKALRNVQ